MSWYQGTNAAPGVVVSTRIRLARNLKNIPFPSRMSKEESETVLKEVAAAVLDRQAGFTLYKTDDLSDMEKRALLEEHLISAELLDPSISRGVLINEDRSIAIMINEEDHVRLQVILPGFCPEEAWDAANRMDSLLGESLTFAFHEKMGYLTACPTNTGTGMRASAMMHLPALALTGSLGNLLNSVGKLGMSVRGLYGEGTEAQGNFYQISNQRTLGMTEEELLSRFASVIRELTEKETAIRGRIAESGDAAVRDRVSRAYGILKNAYLLSGKEFMNLYSDVRLGQSLGFLPEAAPDQDALLVTTQPASLCKEEGKLLSAAARDQKRAAAVRKGLKGVE